jgi:hypothetical protein
MVNMVSIVAEKTAEMTLPNACVTCGGDLQLRISPTGARTYCTACHVIAKPEVMWNDDGAKLDIRQAALA